MRRPNPHLLAHCPAVTLSGCLVVVVGQSIYSPARECRTAGQPATVRRFVRHAGRLEAGGIEEIAKDFKAGW